MKPRYWHGTISELDDFGKPIYDEFIDGRTVHGPWAIMAPGSWRLHGCGKLGTGCGQLYEKLPNGAWLKVEG